MGYVVPLVSPRCQFRNDFTRKHVAECCQSGIGDLHVPIEFEGGELRAPPGHRGHPGVSDFLAMTEVEGGELRAPPGHRGHPGVSDLKTPPSYII